VAVVVDFTIAFIMDPGREGDTLIGDLGRVTEDVHGCSTNRR